MRKSLSLMASAAYVSMSVFAYAQSHQPWLDKSKTPDERAKLVIAAMTLDEKIILLHGIMPLALLSDSEITFPEDSIPGAGYIAGIPRLGIPALKETDASLGVTNPLGSRPGDVATALPASLALGASFNPALAYEAGAVVASEARKKGFNVLLGGGINLTRDPRNGRNFEYIGEDPLLSGIMGGEAVRGTQDQNVISTVKHYVLNAHETNRHTLDALIDRAALRESDLLAFQIAIERGQPGAIMCAYNKVNGAYGCGDDWSLNEVLKKDWGYKGWVLSDWGAVHSVDYAVAGLDQQSGAQLDKEIWFDKPLKAAVQDGRIPESRVTDMAYRIVHAMFAVGVVDNPPVPADIDYKKNAETALKIAQQGIVLLKNENDLLPLVQSAKRIAVIGGQAHMGVLSGSGSAQGTPSNGPTKVIPIGGHGDFSVFRNAIYYPSAPVAEIQKLVPDTKVLYDAGLHPLDAADLAKKSDVAIVFVTRHELEGYDVPDMNLPHGQNELIAAVAAANPRTIVVLETGNPVTMPWLDSVGAVIAAWYPGQEGGQAIAEILLGKINPSGRLPITFPVNDAATVRPELPNRGAEADAQVSISYVEGADVGYRWHAKSGVKPLFSFGYGLTYTSFEYSNLKVRGGDTVTVEFDVKNTGKTAGADVPQLYLRTTPQEPSVRLLGFERVELAPGQRKRISFKADPRILAKFDESARQWSVAGGDYKVSIGKSASDFVLDGTARIKDYTIKP